LTIAGVTPIGGRVPVRRWCFRGAALIAACTLAACASTGGKGGRPGRQLKIAVTETGGDFVISLEEPVRTVTCMERDFRRGAGDPMAARLIWSARCTGGRDCLTSVRYNDASLDTTSPAQRLTTSEQGTCYECELAGDHGRAAVRFRVTTRGGFEPCRL
jgi:hypothetical protein